MYIKNHNRFYNIDGFREITWSKNNGVPNIAVVEVIFSDTVEDAEGYNMPRSIVIDLDNTCAAAIEAGEYSRVEDIINNSAYNNYEKEEILPLLYDLLSEKVYVYIIKQISAGENIIDISGVIDKFIKNTLKTACGILTPAACSVGISAK